MTGIDPSMVCQMVCAELFDAGLWRGYLSYGHCGIFDSDAYCGLKLALGTAFLMRGIQSSQVESRELYRCSGCRVEEYEEIRLSDYDVHG